MMKYVPTFESFITEADTSEKTVTKVVPLKFDLTDWDLGVIDDEVTVAFSPDSRGLYSIGDDIEKFTGVPEEEIKRDFAAGKETPDDALIYGMQNIMNGGKDIYLWINGTRLAGSAAKNGIMPAATEILSHEGGGHLARKVLCRALAKKEGISTENEEWVKHDWGSGEYMWPAIGDDGDPKNPIVMIPEEAFVTCIGYCVQAITPVFFEMAETYIPELSVVKPLLKK